jgi:hypothetical protein
LPQVVYASGANGIAGDDPSTLAEDLEPLFECIVREVAPPSVRLEAPLQLLVTNLDCASLFLPFLPLLQHCQGTGQGLTLKPVLPTATLLYSRCRALKCMSILDVVF